MRDSGSDAEALIPTYDPTFYDYTALCTTEKHLTQRSRLPLPRRIIFPICASCIKWDAASNDAVTSLIFKW